MSKKKSKKKAAKRKRKKVAKRARGRPWSDDPRTHLATRLNTDEWEDLRYIMRANSESKSQALRRAVIECAERLRKKA